LSPISDYLTNSTESSVPLDGHVDLNPGLGGQGGAGGGLNVEVERVFLRIRAKTGNAVQVGLVGMKEVRPGVSTIKFSPLPPTTQTIEGLCREY